MASLEEEATAEQDELDKKTTSLEEAAAEQDELDKKTTSLEEVEEIDSVLGESFFIAYEEDMSLKEIEAEDGEEEETEVKIDYQEIQMQIILSDLERKIMWDQYKSYVDAAVLTGLKEATFCRLVIYCTNKYFNEV